jgi:hypothetical protein
MLERRSRILAKETPAQLHYICDVRVPRLADVSVSIYYLLYLKATAICAETLEQLQHTRLVPLNI